MSSTRPTSARISDEQLAQIVRRLVDVLAPRAIYAFGSQVYGTPTPDSDLDLLVVLSDNTPSMWELGKLGYACLHGLGLPVELHFATETKFQRFSSVVGSLHREVRQKGRVLYAA